MARHIDAEKLKCSIDSETDSIFDWGMTIEELYYNLCELIDDEPTVDAQEVKHGEWKPIFMTVAYEYAGKTFDLRGIECSECGEEMIYELKESFQPKPNYCPNCGARMDGEGK